MIQMESFTEIWFYLLTSLMDKYNDERSSLREIERLSKINVKVRRIKKMKLWTVQPQKVISIIEKTGEFICDETKSDKDFRKAYEWIAKEMDKRHIVHPEDLVLPLWA